MADMVREPIQVYLTRDERSDLDRVAQDLGVSRSEVLRRGIAALSAGRPRSRFPELVEAGIVKPAATPPGDPPPSTAIAPLDAILRELARDREER